jgi:uncharacterized NAD(P)/FAD-binding protein YdhS
MPATNRQTAVSGVMTAAISNSMVGLLHRYTGRGPTRARTTIGENVIVCVMGATLTKAEQSLVQDGKAEVVLHSRRAFAFMSNNHIDPDLAVEVFILEPERSDLLEDQRVDGHGPHLDGGPGLDGTAR